MHDTPVTSKPKSPKSSSFDSYCNNNHPSARSYFPIGDQSRRCFPSCGSPLWLCAAWGVHRRAGRYGMPLSLAAGWNNELYAFGSAFWNILYITSRLGRHFRLSSIILIPFIRPALRYRIPFFASDETLSFPLFFHPQSFVPACILYLIT